MKKKIIGICICTLMIVNVFVGTVIAQIQKNDNVSEKTSNNGILDENNIHNTYMIRQNNPPIMDWIKGPTEIMIFQIGKWQFHAYDNDSIMLLFVIDWGDGTHTTTQWYSCIGGAYGSVFHIYIKKGDYTIKVHAQDGQGGISDDIPFPVTVKKPTDKSINTSFLQLLLNFIQNHPNLFPILKYILEL